MKPKKQRRPPMIPTEPVHLFPTIRTFRQAWNLFVFSSLFALVFNAFYVDGIELKAKPVNRKGFHPVAPLAYEGFTKPASQGTSPKRTHKTPTPSPAPSGNIIRLSLIGAKDRFDKKSAVFLDARKPEEYNEGHISGALNFYGNEPEKFAPLVLPQLTDRNQEIIAYCHGGDCDLSLLAARALIQSGYTRVEIFEGGWPEWKKAAYPVKVGEAP